MNRSGLAMVLCIAIPLGLIIALPYVWMSTWSDGWLLVVVLVCPLLHLLLIRRDAHLGEDQEGDSDGGQ